MAATSFDTLFPVLSRDVRLAAKIWTHADMRLVPLSQHARRAVAYPGWLDNAGSFDTLAPLLCEQLKMTICCIDPPGCGFSDHRPRSSVYSDFEEVPLIGEVADQCGWDNFVLIGHSRGGAISAWFAGLQPSRVISLISLESNFGMTGQWIRDLMPGAPGPVERMNNAVTQLKRNLTREVKVFESISEAVEANKNNPTFKKNATTARNIVLRHIRPHPQGFTFIHDPKTYGQSQFIHVSEEQTKAFITNISAPVLHIVRSKEAWAQFPRAVVEHTERRVALIRNRTEMVVPGGHHVHSDEPEATCAAIVPWLLPILLKNEDKSVVAAKL